MSAVMEHSDEALVTLIRRTRQTVVDHYANWPDGIGQDEISHLEHSLFQQHNPDKRSDLPWFTVGKNGFDKRGDKKPNSLAVVVTADMQRGAGRGFFWKLCPYWSGGWHLGDRGTFERYTGPIQ